MKEKFKTNKDKIEQEHNGKKCIMLAHGESGHAHAFYDTDVVEYNEDIQILTVKEKASLEHEEHTTHIIEPGIGEVTIQREYKQGILKKVID